MFAIPCLYNCVILFHLMSAVARQTLPVLCCLFCGLFFNCLDTKPSPWSIRHLFGKEQMFSFLPVMLQTPLVATWAVLCPIKIITWPGNGPYLLAPKNELPTTYHLFPQCNKYILFRTPYFPWEQLDCVFQIVLISVNSVFIFIEKLTFWHLSKSNLGRSKPVFTSTLPTTYNTCITVVNILLILIDQYRQALRGNLYLCSNYTCQTLSNSTCSLVLSHRPHHHTCST